MMSDNDIRKGFQSKLSGFEAPVPPDGWDSVERSLRIVAAARTALRRRWYAGSVAAAVVLLIGSMLFVRSPEERTEMMVSESAPTPSLTDGTPHSVTEPATVSEAAVPDPVAGAAEAAQLLLVESSISKARIGEQPVSGSSAPEEITEARMERGALEPKQSVQKDVEQNGRNLLEEETIVVEGGNHSSLFAEAGVAETRKGTLLLSVNGRGGLTGYQQMVNSPMTLRSMSVAINDAQHNKVLARSLQVESNNVTSNVSEMEHDLPVSFGITVSRYLLDDLSIETGIVYSYLHSKTRNTNNNFKVDEVQKLHYLGIPLSVNYNLFTLKRLNVYASVGGMVEKDVYGEFRKLREGSTAESLNTASVESEEMKVTKISQSNPQFSVNAGVGLSYPLYDRLRLYGKIGGAYYFDAKNEHKTIYSDRKIVMDLNLGLRYEF